MSIGNFQASAMDAAKVLLGYFPVLEGVQMLVAAIQPDPGALKPH